MPNKVFSVSNLFWRCSRTDNGDNHFHSSTPVSGGIAP